MRRAAGSDVAADGFSRPYIAAVAYGSALYGFLAVLLTINARGAAGRRVGRSARPEGRATREGSRRPEGRAYARMSGHRRPDLQVGRAPGITNAPLLGSLVVWAGSPLLFYMYVAPPMSHACSAFAVALFVTVWLHVRRRPGRCAAIVALGVAAGLMAMVREQDAFFAIGPALDFVLNGRRWTARLRRAARSTALAGCAATVLDDGAAARGLPGARTGT